MASTPKPATAMPPRARPAGARPRTPKLEWTDSIDDLHEFWHRRVPSSVPPDPSSRAEPHVEITDSVSMDADLVLEGGGVQRIGLVGAYTS